MKLYEFKVSAIIEVEGNSIEEAIESAEKIAAEIEANLPVEAKLIQKNGQAEVNFVGFSGRL